MFAAIFINSHFYLFRKLHEQVLFAVILNIQNIEIPINIYLFAYKTIFIASDL
jgi:hypothetical protein